MIQLRNIGNKFYTKYKQIIKSIFTKISYLLSLVLIYIICDYYHHSYCGGINAVFMMFNPLCSWLLWIMTQMSHFYTISILSSLVFLIVEIKNYGNNLGLLDKDIDKELSFSSNKLKPQLTPNLKRYKDSKLNNEEIKESIEKNDNRDSFYSFYT